MSNGQGSADWNMPDDTGAGQTDLNTLFGFNEGVGKAPIILQQGRDMRRFGEPEIKSTFTRQTTLAEVLQQFYTMGPDEMANLQQQLLAGGFYADKFYSKNAKRPKPGVADDDSYAAFKRAVVQAARSGQALPDVIGEAGEARAAGADSTTPVEFTSPDDLRAQFDAAGPGTIGRRPDPGVIDNAIAVYHNLEAEAANKTDAAGNVTAPPSVSAFAQEYLRRTYPADAYRQGYVEAYQAFSDLIDRTAQNG